MSRLYSAAQLAELKLPELPVYRNNIATWISKIAADNPELVAKRAGRGGGLLVDFTALPRAAQAAIEQREQAKALAATERQEVADAHEHAQRQLVVHGTADLSARQRMVMDARAALLNQIEAQAIMSGVSRDKVMRDVIAQAGSGTLNDDLAGMVRRANDRADGVTISKRTLERWFAARKKRGVVALAPQKTNELHALPDWFDDFLKLYAVPSKPSMEGTVLKLQKSHPAGETIHVDQVRRAFAKLPMLLKVTGREGKLAMRTRMAYTVRDVSDLMPTTVYVADGKTFDAEIAHPKHGQPFRPELTTIIDAATRRVVGWSAALDENTFAVVDALRRACQMSGIPAIFYTDRGPGYKNKNFDAPLTGFMGRAGITAMRALPYNSQAKGVVERLNQVYTGAAKALPTYMGKEMDKEAKLVVFKSTRRELAYTGTSKLLLGWDGFLDLIDQTLSAYNDRPHSGLPKFRDPQLSRMRHMTPNELWSQKTQGFEPILPSELELDDMFRPYVVRKTRRALVEWLGNSYYHGDLEAHHGQNVIVGYDIRDASQVWVRRIDLVDDTQMPGRLIAIAQFEGHKTRYVPLTYERDASEKRAKGRIARVQNKMDEINAELNGSFISLKPEPEPIYADFSLPVEPVQLSDFRPLIDENATPISNAVKRPIFRDDVSFASFLAANPELATGTDKELLRELLTNHSTKELLRMSNVNLEALRQILRSDV